jgi:uncharacterized protein
VIKVLIKIDSDQILKEITIEGHSNLSLKGKDIVCASVSVLAYTAYLSFKTIPSTDMEFVDNDKFFIKIKRYDHSFMGELLGISLFLMTGLKALEKDHGINVRIEMTGS